MKALTVAALLCVACSWLPVAAEMFRVNVEGTVYLLRAARAAGVNIRCDAPVRRIRIDNSRAIGVKLEDGEEIDAATGRDLYGTLTRHHVARP